MAKKSPVSPKGGANSKKASSEAGRKLAGVQEVLQLHERYAEVLAKTGAYTSQHADIEASLSNVSSP